MICGPIRDLARIEAFLRRDEAAHVYAIADLEEPFGSRCSWFAAESDDGIQAIALLLHGLSLPILYAVCPPADPAARALLAAILPALPDRFFYNLGPELDADLSESFRLEPEGRYWKMALSDRLACERVSPDGVEPLGTDDLSELTAFLERDAYQEHETGGLFFEPAMLASGAYRGIRERGRLVAIGGVHVHSTLHGVAGIGNVVTRPDARGRGLARRVSAAVIRALLPEAPCIGLNVHEGNTAARRCYEQLGFEQVRPYDEGVAVRRASAS